jgi:hypothetical protein
VCVYIIVQSKKNPNSILNFCCFEAYFPFYPIIKVTLKIALQYKINQINLIFHYCNYCGARRSTTVDYYNDAGLAPFFIFFSLANLFILIITCIFFNFIVSSQLIFSQNIKIFQPKIKLIKLKLRKLKFNIIGKIEKKSVVTLNKNPS